MSETTQEPTAVEEAMVDLAPKTFIWEVWRDCPAGIGQVNTHIMERRGALEHDSAYSVLNYDYTESALARIAEIGGGPGDYVLIHDERVLRVSIVAETVYRRAEEQS